MIGLLIAAVTASATPTPALDKMTDLFILSGACERYMTDEDRRRFNAYVQPAPRDVQDYLAQAREQGRTMKLSSYQCRVLFKRFGA